jgi:hypothetical protein
MDLIDVLVKRQIADDVEIKEWISLIISSAKLTSYDSSRSILFDELQGKEVFLKHWSFIEDKVNTGIMDQVLI